jgi:hypothetical protein
MSLLNVVKHFDALETEPSLPDKRYKALKIGDKILVQLDGDEPEVKTFRGFGLRTLLIATQYLGFNYEFFYVNGGQPNNQQQNHFKIAVHRSRLRGLAAVPENG